MEFASPFKKKNAYNLPLYKPGFDHEIRLQASKGAPWWLSYGMMRDESLVLRKTLTELLVKNFTRPSGFPAGLHMLFVHKPGEDLRFRVDYRVLNLILRVERYALPLIKEQTED